ncbi:MAG: hypothetical protein ACE5H8_14570 [Alphaproteobacteria bacterium]
MPTQIDKLREVKERCLSGEPLGHELGGWLGSALDAYLSRRSRTVEEAFGLCFPQGGVPWWLEEAIRMRDAALRALAECFFADLSPGAQARNIRRIASRYAASAWRIDRDRETMPRHYRGTVKEFLWIAFTSGATMPLGERQLRNVLAC